MEKIDKKILETRKRILVSIAITLSALILEFGFMVLLGGSLKNANPLRFVFGVITFGLIGALIGCELIWLVDCIEARFRALRNVIYITLNQDKDIDFVGNIRLEREEVSDKIETIRGK